MKLEKYKERSHEYTEKASDIIRNLCFAGIGIIWIFRNVDNSGSPIDGMLIYPLILLALSLLFDLGQYFIGGVIWIRFFRKREKDPAFKDPELDVKAKPIWNKPVYFCYYAKVVLMVGAYVLIILHLSNEALMSKM